MINFAVKIVIFFDSRVLCLKRSEKEEWAKNLWDIPGGRIKKEELVIDSLKREIEEETGIKIRNQNILPLRLWEVPEKSLIGLTFVTFLSKLPKEIRPSGEHSKYKWIRREEIEDLDMHPGLKKDLETAFEFAKSRNMVRFF